MCAMALSEPRYDDPRLMRELLERFGALSKDHALQCVVVGLRSGVGDLAFPEIVDFLEAALRVDDRIFRMTRERAVLFLADVDDAMARAVLDRNLERFREEFAPAEEPQIEIRTVEIDPTDGELSVKDVLPVLFE